MNSRTFLYVSIIITFFGVNDIYMHKIKYHKTNHNSLLKQKLHCGTNETPKQNTDKWRKETMKLDKIKVKNKYFVDSQGRTVLFHGLNAVEKGPPWYPNWLLNDTKIKELSQYGFNVIRLGTMWTGVMPKEGIINRTYIDTLQQIVTTLGSNGIYVILDMHQDGLSSEFRSYDGAPKWLVDKLPKPKRPFPWPLSNITSWPQVYITDAVGKAFQGIYNNYAKSRTYLAFFWQIIAKYFKHFDNVLGYELINEPWAGDIYSYPSLLLPGNAGKKNLQPLYNELSQVIREFDNRTIIFYEPVTWGIFSNGSTIGSGFTQVPGGSDFVNRSSLSYHYYCWLLGKDDAHKPYPWIKRDICDKELAPKAFKTVQKDISKTGGASFLTEFGLCGPDGIENSTSTIECDTILHFADKYLQSWAYWGTNDFQRDFDFTNQSIAPFARVYARKIAGHPLNMEFHLGRKSFEFEYIPYNSISSSFTEIFIPQMHFPNGYVLIKPRDLKCHYDRFTNLLFIDGSNFEGHRVKIYLKAV